jgi:uncharacterized protein YdaU (DUF1376 family)
MQAEQSRAPYYIKLHLGDYERDTVELSLLQDGAYFRLMRWYYSTGRPIPNDIERIYRRVHATSIEEQGAVRYVLENFFILDGPVWRQKRIDQEIIEWCDRSRSAVAAVERREKKRNEINKIASSNDDRLIIDRSSNQNQNQNHKREPLKPSRKTSVSKDFKPSDRVLEWAKAKNYINIERHCETFIAKCLAKGYKYSDWDAAFMEAIRKDWAGIGNKAPQRKLSL